MIKNTQTILKQKIWSNILRHWSIKKDNQTYSDTDQPKKMIKHTQTLINQKDDQTYSDTDQPRKIIKHTQTLINQKKMIKHTQTLINQKRWSNILIHCSTKKKMIKHTQTLLLTYNLFALDLETSISAYLQEYCLHIPFFYC
jgi:hypothetical protein